MAGQSTGAGALHVGYIGLGIMGSAMVMNLLAAGFRVTVYNRTSQKCADAVAAGAVEAKSPAEVASSGAQVICINVTNTPDVERVIFGEEGIVSGVKPGSRPVVVDHSTISPVATEEFAHRLAKSGIGFLDAPVSGGDVGAKNGTLSIMVGGEPEDFAFCMPMFEKVGKSIVHMGPAGMGQACKACNQVSVVLNLLATCEALALAKKCGLDPEKMIQVVSGGAGASWQLANLGPRIVKGDMAPGFMIDLVLKDLGIVSDTAREKGLAMVGTQLAEAYFRAAAQNGAGREGTQAMCRTLESLGNFRYKSE